ncbi:MAG: sodium/glutamate symporter [Planctomycetota bacterium]|jgi:ESS family glutamate:Na+ symporter
MQSFIALCLLLWVGHLLRMKVRLLQKLYLPSCVIAGLLGLIVIQAFQAAGNPIPPVWTAGWSKLPGMLINVVFACLFLGVTLPRIGVLARRAGPQLGYGQIVAWGQYVVGVGLFLTVVTVFWPGLPAMFGAIIPVGFEGGHGTAAGLAETFTKLDWEAGKDFALASATAGIISAIVVGMVLINWAVRRGHVVASAGDVGAKTDNAVIPPDRRPSAGKLTVSADAIESLTLHLAVVGIACGLGWLLKQGMVAGTQALSGQAILDAISDWPWWARWLWWPVRVLGSKQAVAIASSFPLFPLCMLGGLVVQIFEQKFDKSKLIDGGLTRRIQNIALDFLVVAAIAMIRVESLTGYLAPFFILIAAGILWNVFCVLVLAKRLLPDAWFERSIAEMGQSMGVTATGLLLLRVVDPKYESPAVDAFASKQLLHEPFMGGGLWTSAALPFLYLWGGVPVFLIAVGAMAAWLIILLIARAMRTRAR